METILRGQHSPDSRYVALRHVARGPNGARLYRVEFPLTGRLCGAFPFAWIEKPV